VKAAAVCGSDVHTYKSGAIAEFGRPMILGHEFSGEIVKIGDNVKGLVLGDRVLGSGIRFCGKCWGCQHGQAIRCSNITTPGHGMDGAFAEYVVVPNPALGKLLFKIPPNMSWEEAALVEPLSVSCYAVEQAHIKSNETVVVLGAGPIGIGVIQLAKVKGAGKVIVSEPSAKRLAAAQKLGADIGLNPKETDVVEAVREATSRTMASLVFECSGEPDALRQAISMMQPYGRVMQIGVFLQNIELDPVLVSQMTFTNVTWRGCGGRTMDTVVELMQTGQIKVRDWITHEFSLDDTRKAFEAQANFAESIKVMIKP
jgi:2-desacetyl-2-hydroxyethyl bacteriochlorophyllide A dehydrogenase